MSSTGRPIFFKTDRIPVKRFPPWLIQWREMSIRIKTQASGPVSISIALTFLAILSCGLLLLADIAPQALASVGHVALSAAPLILIGAAYIALQCLLRPGFKELSKRLLLGLAFILWGIDQLLPPSRASMVLGDAVITLFVVDLGLITLAHLKQTDDADTL
jgi:hypothetical protein